MDPSVYKRPKKPKTILVKNRRDKPKINLPEIPKPVELHTSSECHITPSDVAARMVQYLTPAIWGHTLEPSAGTGALVLPAEHAGHWVDAVESDYHLCEQLKNLMPAHRVFHADFLKWGAHLEGTKYNRIVMNPPFRQVKQHMTHAISLLEPGRGILVALVPVTYEHPNAELLEKLPNDTFALCKVNTKIIRIILP